MANRAYIIRADTGRELAQYQIQRTACDTWQFFGPVRAVFSVLKMDPLSAEKAYTSSLSVGEGTPGLSGEAVILYTDGIDGGHDSIADALREGRRVYEAFICLMYHHRTEIAEIGELAPARKDKARERRIIELRKRVLQGTEAWKDLPADIQQEALDLGVVDQTQILMWAEAELERRREALRQVVWNLTPWMDIPETTREEAINLGVVSPAQADEWQTDAELEAADQ